MKPSVLYPSLVLVHHVASGDMLGAFTGNLEQWGQWGTGGDFSACHVEATFNGDNIARMNPKVSMLYPIVQAPWPNITCLRLDLTRFAGYGVPQYPDQDPIFINAFQAEVDKHLGEAYAWGQIARFTFIGLLARVWPSKAQEMLKSANDSHAHVCSQWLTDRLETAVQAAYGHLSEHLAQYDLFEGTNVGEGEERPADYVKSLDLKSYT